MLLAHQPAILVFICISCLIFFFCEFLLRVTNSYTTTATTTRQQLSSKNKNKQTIFLNFFAEVFVDFSKNFIAKDSVNEAYKHNFLETHIFF